MTNRPLPFVVAIAAACGGPARPDPTPPAPMSFEAHMAKADEREQLARTHQDEADSYGKAPLKFHCNTNAASEELTIGGEKPRQLVPCWSIEREASKRHEQQAEKLREEAQRHRSMAKALVEVERTSCKGLSMDELSRTPFWHKDDIAAVARFEEGGALRGARITFAPIAGLDAAWMRRAIECHRARAATMGHDPAFMPYDPTVLHDLQVTVAGDSRGVVVTVRAHDPSTATLVWSRAESLRTRP